MKKSCPRLVVGIKYVVFCCILGFGIWTLGFLNIPVKAQTSTVNFLYDAVGQRVARLPTGGEHVYYVSPSLEVTVKADGSVSWKRNYYFGGSAVAVREGNSSGSTVSYLHQDHLGSTALATNQQGQVISQQVYFPYGKTRAISGSSPTEREYTGQISDVDTTGLYYYNARYYDPQLAKFTQADTMGDGLNRYLYATDNPVNYIDPSGHVVMADDSGGNTNSTCNPEDYSCRHPEYEDKSAQLPEWYILALQGDYSQVPPMGFTRPSEMHEWVEKYGLTLLAMRGEEGMRLVQAWSEFNESLTPIQFNDYWNRVFDAEQNTLLEQYPDLQIELSNLTGIVAGAYLPGQSTIRLPIIETRPLSKLAVLMHESTHYVDTEIIGIESFIDSEINAFFTMSNIPYLTDYDQSKSRTYLQRLSFLRKSYDDGFINYMHHRNVFDDPQKYIYQYLSDTYK